MTITAMFAGSGPLGGAAAVVLLQLTPQLGLEGFGANPLNVDTLLAPVVGRGLHADEQQKRSGKFLNSSAPVPATSDS